MATKKKPPITVQQVTENLRRLFPGKEVFCTEIIQLWNDTCFYIETNMVKVVVIGKMVWVKPSIRRWADYIIFCNNTGAAYKKMRTKIGTCIPFLCRKGDRNKPEAETLLVACGLKPDPAIRAANPVNRLRELGGQFYVQAYSVFKDVKIVSAYFYHASDRYNRDRLFCAVITDSGSYKFPIESALLVPADQDEIQAIFGDLLGITLLVAEKPKDRQIAA